MRPLIAIALILVALAASFAIDLECTRCEGIEVIAWNAQNLGPTKLEDGRLDRIVDVIDDYDVIVLQEITDASGAAPERVCELLVGYACTVSERTGTNRKEQYLIAARFPITATHLLEHPDLERGVYAATIDVGYDVTIATVHLKPDRVRQELIALEDVLGSQGIVLAGDLNADCSYLREGTRTYLPRYRWIITDDADTTLSNSDCAYDRYAVTSDLVWAVVGYRILDADDALSDHAPIMLVLR